MNIFRFFTLIILSISTLSAQKTTTFTCRMSGYTEGVAQLLGVFVDENFLADSAKISNDGTFVFKKAEGYADGMYYVLMPDKENFSLLIANGENGFTLSSQRGALSVMMQVEGSFENKLYFESIKYQIDLEKKFAANAQAMQRLGANSPQMASLRQQQQALLDERDAKVLAYKKDYPKAFFTTFKLAGQNPKLRPAFTNNGMMDSVATMVNYRYDWWNDFDFNDPRLLRTPVFFNKLKKYITELTTQRPDTLISAASFLINKTLGKKEYFNVAANWISYQYKPGVTTLMDGEAVYSHLILTYFTPENTAGLLKPDELKSTRETAQQMQASLLGKIGQNVQAKDKNGVMRSIYDIKTPFKVIYIYSPNCEHCQEETPQLRKVYDTWKARGLEIFSIVANAKDRNEWQSFAQKYGINWIDVYDPTVASRFHEKYFVDITPELYVLDKDNRIIAKNLKPAQLPEVLEQASKLR